MITVCMVIYMNGDLCRLPTVTPPAFGTQPLTGAVPHSTRPIHRPRARSGQHPRPGVTLGGLVSAGVGFVPVAVWGRRGDPAGRTGRFAGHVEYCLGGVGEEGCGGGVDSLVAGRVAGRDALRPAGAGRDPGAAAPTAGRGGPAE